MAEYVPTMQVKKEPKARMRTSEFRDFSGSEAASSLESQFSRVRPPKSYIPSNILDPVKPVPVQGSIGGTGVDMSPYLNDAAQRRNLAIADASHRLAVAQFRRDGEMIGEQMEAAKRAEKANELRQALQDKLAFMAEKRLGEAVKIDQQNADLREREVKIRETDTPEARLKEDEARTAKRIEMQEAADARERGVIDTRQKEADTRRATINNAVRDAVATTTNTGTTPNIEGVTAAAIAAIPGADKDPVMQDDIARAVRIAMENRSKFVKSYQDEQAREMKEAETLADDAIAFDSTPEAVADEPLAKQAEEAGYTNFSEFMSAMIGMASSTDPAAAQAFGEEVRTASAGMTLYQLNELASANNNAIASADLEYQAGIQEIDTQLAQAKGMPESDERNEVIKNLYAERAKVPAIYKAKRDSLNIAKGWLDNAVKARKSMWRGVAKEQARKNGIDRYNQFYQNNLFDTTTGAEG